MTIRQIIDKLLAYGSIFIVYESQQRLILDYLSKIPENRLKWELRRLFAKLIKELPLEKLELYIDNSDCCISKKAKERCDELIEQLCLEKLPEYLANSNQYIRKKTKERHEQLTKGEET